MLLNLEFRGNMFICIMEAGVNSGKQLYGGGLGVPQTKGRSRFRLSVSNVATEISPAQEQVQFSLFSCYMGIYAFCS